MKHVAVYTRTSIRHRTDEDGQSEAIDKFLVTHGIHAVAYHDTGAVHADRPAFTRMMAGVGTGEVTEIIVWKLNRIDTKMSALTRIFGTLREHEVKLTSVTEGVALATTTTAAGRLMANIVAAMTQFDAEMRESA